MNPTDINLGEKETIPNEFVRIFISRHLLKLKLNPEVGLFLHWKRADGWMAGRRLSPHTASTAVHLVASSTGGFAPLCNQRCAQPGERHCWLRARLHAELWGAGGDLGLGRSPPCAGCSVAVG